jgi:hypothetical protein
MKTLIKVTIATALSLAVLIHAIFLRITNIDMTELRLFITYWPRWIVMMVVFIIARCLFKSATGDKEKK